MNGYYYEVYDEEIEEFCSRIAEMMAENEQKRSEDKKRARA